MSHPGKTSRTKILVVIGTSERSLTSSDRAAIGQSVTLPKVDVAVCNSTDSSAVRYAVAAGATQLVELPDDKSDLVVFGRGGLEPMGDLLPAKIALTRNAELVFDVLKFKLSTNRLEIIRDLGRGVREILRLDFPVVLVMSDQAESPLYVSRFRQQAVQWSTEKNNLDTEIEIADVPTNQISWQTSRPRTKTGMIQEKTGGDAKSRMFAAFGLAESDIGTTSGRPLLCLNDSQTAASHLIRFLAHHGFIDSGFQNVELSSANSGVEGFFENGQLSGELDGATTIVTRPESLTIANARGPRPLVGNRLGMARRPRRYPSGPDQTRLAFAPWLVRGPRSLGHSKPNNLRGPFPM